MTLVHDEVAARTAISRAVVEERLARVRAWMAESKLDALVVYGAPAALGSRATTSGYLRYLTGWMTSALPAMVVLPLEGNPTVITMGPHDTRVFEQQAGWFGSIVATGNVERYPTQALRALAAITAKGAVGTLGLWEMPGPLYQIIRNGLLVHQIVEAAPAVDELRLHRHPEEVSMHRAGARISDAMIEVAMGAAVQPGMTGTRLMAEIEHAGRVRGAGTPSAWLAIGQKPATTFMEMVEVEAPIGPADRVALGTNLTYEGYFAQGLRMGVRRGASQALTQCSATLMEIQDAALDTLRPGTLLHEVSDVIESMIDGVCPYSRDTDPFRFQSCHGLGLSYVEPGMARDLNARRDRTLDPAGVRIKEHMVVEVHPNFTHPELGHVCAGDMALVTARGAEWITSYPRGLVEL